jgi:hypothetical protein
MKGMQQYLQNSSTAETEPLFRTLALDVGRKQSSVFHQFPVRKQMEEYLENYRDFKIFIPQDCHGSPGRAVNEAMK